MKISLRKADAIQRQIRQEMAEMNVNTMVTLDEHSDPIEVLDQHRAKFNAEIRKMDDLNLALTDIRFLVGQMNQMTGVNDKLAYMAEKQRMITFLSTSVMDMKPRDDRVVKSKYEQIKQLDPEKLTSRTFSSNFLTQDEIDQYHNNIRRMEKSIQQTKDELLEINMRNDIELSSETVIILEDYNIL